MDLDKKFKAKELRKMSEKEQKELLPELDRQISQFKSVSCTGGGEGLVSLPSGDRGGTNWGMFNTMKKNKAMLLTVMTENRSGRGKI